LTLDDDGNATVGVIGGPSCAPSTDRISASLNAPPFVTVATSLKVLAPQDTKTGVTAVPASEVEDSVYSSFVTLVQVELPSVYSEKDVILKSDELNARCAPGGIVWISPDTVSGGDGAEVTVQLDNNGNAFALVYGPYSCASGLSTITADLTSVPYTTEVGSFRILSPRVTV